MASVLNPDIGRNKSIPPSLVVLDVGQPFVFLPAPIIPPDPVVAAVCDPFPLDMYRFLIAPIRESDHRVGNLFVKRYLDGPNDIWKDIVCNLQNIPKLWSVDDIQDEHLQFLKNILGWTEELEHITDRLDFNALRRLIASSGALWRERGPEQGILDVLNIVTGGVRSRIWNWFDFRWVLDETELGEEHEGNDPWIIDLPSESRVPQFSSVIPEANAEQFTNLRIVDNGTLDRTLVKDVLNLMRATNERFEITYLDFLDLFSSPGDSIQWDNPSTLALVVADGAAKLSNTAIAESTTAIVSTAATWTQYVYSARIRGNTTASANFGLLFYHTGIDDNYLVAIDTTTQTMTLQKRVAGNPTIIATVDLGSAEINILDDVWYTVRVETIVEASTNRILVFVDGSILIDATDAAHSQGSVGIFHDASATIQCDEVEVMELPVDSETLDINS